MIEINTFNDKKNTKKTNVKKDMGPRIRLALKIAKRRKFLKKGQRMFSFIVYH